MLLSVLTLTFGLGLGKTYLIETAGSGYPKHVRRANPEPEKDHGSDYAEVSAHHDTELASNEASAYEEEVVGHDSSEFTYGDSAYEEEALADHDSELPSGSIEGCLDPVTNVTYKIGETFWVDCNKCLCETPGLTTDAGCTEMFCGTLPPFMDPPFPGSIEGCLDPVTNVTHKIGESFKVDCNTCWCDGGDIACTLMFCPPPIEGCFDPVTNVTHKIGESFKVDCNTCICHAGGHAECTKKGCLPPLGLKLDEGY